MAYNQILANRIREALEHIPDVEEKKMFRGVTFMVDGKMCISVSGDELMVRIDPLLHDTIIEKSYCREMIHSGRTMKGFVYVQEEGIATKEDFDKWINMALDFNKKAKAAPKKKKK
ncbi:TfoX/Sxy family protein [Parasediminibacterium sp. JCM 36343]|uniref:TfoX/Sxy family protein n=1 Tax=Parasediminibacterium sp. JCM 36343 TaxID=3374279 RepID=UPI00397A0467